MNKLALPLCMWLTFATGTVAQDSAKESSTVKKDDRPVSVIPLKVQVVITEFDGEKKIVNTPYTFIVNADERKARPEAKIRSGARVPISTGKDQFTYLDIGTNLDCSAALLEDGRFRLQLSLERSMLSPEANSGTGNPAMRSLRADVNPVLKDGQTLECVVSTDPVTGHVFHVAVTLNVMK